LYWCAEVEESQEEQVKYLEVAHMLVEGGIGHTPSIEDKHSTVVVKIGFGGEWMHEGVSE
jgi:hypothetical protein